MDQRTSYQDISSRQRKIAMAAGFSLITEAISQIQTCATSEKHVHTVNITIHSERAADKQRFVLRRRFDEKRVWADYLTTVFQVNFSW